MILLGAWHPRSWCLDCKLYRPLLLPVSSPQGCFVARLVSKSFAQNLHPTRFLRLYAWGLASMFVFFCRQYTLNELLLLLLLLLFCFADADRAHPNSPSAVHDPPSLTAVFASSVITRPLHLCLSPCFVVIFTLDTHTHRCRGSPNSPHPSISPFCIPNTQHQQDQAPIIIIYYIRPGTTHPSSIIMYMSPLSSYSFSKLQDSPSVVLRPLRCVALHTITHTNISIDTHTYYSISGLLFLSDEKLD
jgi:hypothetical protein